MKSNFSRMFFFTVCIIIFYTFLFAEEVEYQYKETKELVYLVDDAVALIEEKGEDAFAELSVEDSKWRQGEKYIFIIDLEGMVYVQVKTSLIGKNLIDLTDVNGKPFIKWFITEALTKDECGWSHYLWNIPGQDVPTWKTTYVKLATAPSGNKYIAGCGLYNMKMEKAFAIAEVKQAAELIAAQGKEAFKTLKDPESEFVFRNNYIFVINELGDVLVHPASPELEGKNMCDFQDVKGIYLFRELIDVAKKEGSGWVDYWWPKPGEEEPSPKTSYAIQVMKENEIFIVGTGIYLD
ncbi:MAG: cache domain-containing protein [Armatimonadetes bacterium]|nr:cache domain-containing protein [Armatimonadota bacterium]